MNLHDKYRDFCLSMGIPCSMDLSVQPYDNTTLFCPAGMQQFKDKFRLGDGSTIANIQSCIRVNDIDEIGDGTHLIAFDMMGLFSFDWLSVKDAVDFWMEFLKSINLKPDYVTVHPDKKDWMSFYSGIEVRLDKSCTWSDGEIGGYCTEFFKDGIEIGNIVNPMGTSIDCGFGLDRIESILTGKVKTKAEVLIDGVTKIIESGFAPSNKEGGYVLRKLLRMCYREGIVIDHKFYQDEETRQEKILQRWNKIKDKCKGKSPEWIYDTYGIDVSLLED